MDNGDVLRRNGRLRRRNLGESTASRRRRSPRRRPGELRNRAALPRATVRGGGRRHRNRREAVTRRSGWLETSAVHPAARTAADHSGEPQHRSGAPSRFAADRGRGAFSGPVRMESPGRRGALDSPRPGWRTGWRVASARRQDLPMKRGSASFQCALRRRPFRCVDGRGPVSYEPRRPAPCHGRRPAAPCPGPVAPRSRRIRRARA